MESQNIAIVGGGAAGITAAYILDKKHRVTLYEKNNYVGGHTNTFWIEDGPDQGTAVDTGFIVFNDRNYPRLNQLFSQLGVKSQDSEMSFSFYQEESGLQYNGTSINGLFGQRKNLFRPFFYKMIQDILHFNKRALSDLEAGSIGSDVSLGLYLDKLKLSPEFSLYYLLPMGAAIWSTPTKDMLDYPAEVFIRFFKNHGLLSVQNRPQWKTVVGGSQSYVKAFLQQFTGQIELNAQIEHVRRVDGKPIIRLADGVEHSYDLVVLAAHANESLKLLADPSADEQKWLGAWNYSKNHTVLHTDTSVMPPIQRCWASWNYTQELGASSTEPVSLTYHMNRLQRLKTKHQYCVTLNRTKPIDSKKIIREIEYTHPMFTVEALHSQQHLPSLNGKQNTYFCGSYFGYGFHEDAVKSGIAVANELGMDL